MISISLAHIDWSRPIVFVSPFESEGDNGLPYWEARLVSTCIAGAGEQNHLVILKSLREPGKDLAVYVTGFGIRTSSQGKECKPHRVIFNYEGTLPDINDVQKLGEF